MEEKFQAIIISQFILQKMHLFSPLILHSQAINTFSFRLKITALSIYLIFCSCPLTCHKGLKTGSFLVKINFDIF